MTSSAPTKISYSPYEISVDPGRFGLAHHTRRSEYGSLSFYVGPQTKSDVCSVYLHGVGSRWTTWLSLLQTRNGIELANDSFFFDLPGFGDSENLKGTLHASEVGAVLLEVVRSFGYDCVRLVGHSMGGFLAADMAVEFPEKIISLHLVAGAYFTVVDVVQRPWRTLLRSPAVWSTYMSQVAFAHANKLGHTLLNAAFRAHLFPLFLYNFARWPFRLSGSVVQSLCYDQRFEAFVLAAANGQGYDMRSKWSSIGAPVYAVFGQSDRLVSKRDQRTLCDVIPKAEVSRIAACSHMLHVEQPEAVVLALKL